MGCGLVRDLCSHPSVWDQMWLNEGFAEYVSNIASHYIDPEIHTWERFYVEETQWVMYQVVATVVGLIFRKIKISTKVMYYQNQDTRHHWAMTDPVTTPLSRSFTCVGESSCERERRSA